MPRESNGALHGAMPGCIGAIIWDPTRSQRASVERHTKSSSPFNPPLPLSLTLHPCGVGLCCALVSPVPALAAGPDRRDGARFSTVRYHHYSRPPPLNYGLLNHLQGRLPNRTRSRQSSEETGVCLAQRLAPRLCRRLHLRATHPHRIDYIPTALRLAWAERFAQHHGVRITHPPRRAGPPANLLTHATRPQFPPG